MQKMAWPALTFPTALLHNTMLGERKSWIGWDKFIDALEVEKLTCDKKFCVSRCISGLVMGIVGIRNLLDRERLFIV